MIERYTRKEMGEVWTLESRFRFMLLVEIAVAESQARLGIVPRKAAVAIRERSDFSLARIAELERVTKHDVIAFVSSVAEKVGPEGRYVHFAMTSSDILDTALSLQVKTAGDVLKRSLTRLEKALLGLIKKHERTLCSGRTHGMHAEPTTFGLKMAGFLAELRRNQQRVEESLEGMTIAKLSGAVGTFSAQPPEVERLVAKKLGLIPEAIATQVIPRDRHAQLVWSLAMVGAGLERLAVELRHLQRTEVAEVVEGFTPGQKGSSAMPHKKNPISAENITGAARLLRSYSHATMEDIALWHERDISHSSVERVVFPDAFILCDYAVDRMGQLLEGLYVDEARMLQNLESSGGQLYSSHVLLRLVESGLSREEAYALVQKASHGLKKGESLKKALAQNAEVTRRISPKSLERIFSGEEHLKACRRLVKSYLKGEREA